MGAKKRQPPSSEPAVSEWLSRMPRGYRKMLLNSIHAHQTFERNRVFAREGDALEDLIFVTSGVVARQKITELGKRQILSLHFAGEILNHESLLDRPLDGNLQALSRATIGKCDLASLQEQVVGDLSLLRGLTMDAISQAAEFRQWLLNVRRRSSAARVAFLICEIAKKTMATPGEPFELMLTQTQIADAVGMTAIHVNRVFAKLEAEGLISRDQRMITIVDDLALSALAGR